MKLLFTTALALAGLCALPAQASLTTFYGGSLNDASNAALVDSQLGAPDSGQFGDDNYVANLVALYSFHVAVGGTVHVASLAAAAGGIDPYFSLFTGTGNSAAFTRSAIAPVAGDDFELDLILGTGDYTMAIGVFENMSWAENSGGTLGSGFIGLGTPYSLGTYRYEFSITESGDGQALLPEPNAASLAMTALLLMAISSARRPRPAVRPPRPRSET